MNKIEVDNKLFKNDIEYMKFFNKVSNNQLKTISIFILLLFLCLFLPDSFLFSLIIILFALQFFSIYMLNNWQKPLQEVYINKLLSLLSLENLKNLGFDFYNKANLSKKDIFNFYSTNERLQNVEMMNKAKHILMNLDKSQKDLEVKVKEKLQKDNKKIEKCLNYLILTAILFLVINLFTYASVVSTLLISVCFAVFFACAIIIPNKFIVPNMQYSNEEKAAILSTLNETQKDMLKVKMIDYYIRYNKELNAIELVSYLRKHKMIEKV